MPADPRRPSAGSLDERLVARIADLERQVRTMASYVNGGAASQLPVVLALPAAGRVGRALVLRSNGKLYVDDGLNWIPQT